MLALIPLLKAVNNLKFLEIVFSRLNVFCLLKTFTVVKYIILEHLFVFK